MKIKFQQGWKRVLLFLLPFLVTLVFFQLIGSLLSNSLAPPIAINNIKEFIISLTTLAGIVLLLWLFMKFIDKEAFISLGLFFHRKKKDLFLGILLGFIMVGVGFGLLLLLEEIAIAEINFDAEELLFSALLFTCVAFFEELVFRGYVLRNLMFSYHRYLALFLSAVLFAVMHGMNPNLNYISLLNLFLAGILLGISYTHTRNLWFPIGLHFGLNFFQTHFGFNVSGRDQYSMFEFTILEKNFLNGGEFGFEGSLFLVYIQILLIVGIEFYFSAREEKFLRKLSEKL